MPKIFVSSTFKDMHLERDVLKSKITPMINQTLKPYGETIDFIDLRWGIDTSKLESDESNEKILKVCLDEIDETNPYMVVFVGNRYGTIPSFEQMDLALKNKGIDDIDRNISVTNLEIEYGALKNPSSEKKIFFYFRKINNIEKMSKEEKETYEVEDEIHQEKLEALKDKIERIYPKRVRYYELNFNEETHSLDGMEKLIEIVKSDIESELEKDLSFLKDMPLYKRVERQSEKFFAQYENSYVTKNVDESFAPVKVIDHNYTDLPLCEVIIGERGIGRKTTLALKYKKAKTKRDTYAFCYANEINDDTYNIRDFIYHLVNQLEDVKKGFHHEQYGLDDLVNIFHSINTGEEKVEFYIMNANKPFLNLLRMIEARLLSNNHIKFYLEIEDDISGITLPFAFRNKLLVVNPLSNDEVIGVVNNILERKGKELPRSVIEAISRKKGAKSPLYLSLIIEKLLLLNREDFKSISKLGDGMAAIEKYMLSAIEKTSDDIYGLGKNLITTLINIINDDMVTKLISIISTKECNFTKQELISLFKYKNWNFNELSYSLFIHLIPNLFKTTFEASELSFVNEEIRKAAGDVINKSYFYDIIDWLKNGDFKDYIFTFTRDRLPLLYINNDALNLYVYDYIEMVNNYNAIEDVKSYQDRTLVEEYSKAYASFPSGLMKTVLDDTDFAYRANIRIIELLREHKIPNPTKFACFHFDYISPNYAINGDKQLRKTFKHYLHVLELYRNEYERDKTNYVFHFFYMCCALKILIISPDNSIVNMIDDEDSKIYKTNQALFNSDEEQAFLSEISTKHELFIKTRSMDSLIKFISFYENGGIPPAYKPSIKAYLKQSIALLGDRSFIDIYDVIHSPMEANLHAVIGIIYALYYLTYKDELTDNEDIYALHAEMTLSGVVKYVIDGYDYWANGIFRVDSYFLSKVFIFLGDILDAGIIKGEKNYEFTKNILTSIGAESNNVELVKALLYNMRKANIYPRRDETVYLYDLMDKYLNECKDITILSEILVFYTEPLCYTLPRDKYEAFFEKAIVQTFKASTAYKGMDLYDNILEDVFLALYQYSENEEVVAGEEPEWPKFALRMFDLIPKINNKYTKEQIVDKFRVFLKKWQEEEEE